jgi:hypothetical protein
MWAKFVGNVGKKISEGGGPFNEFTDLLMRIEGPLSKIYQMWAMWANFVGNVGMWAMWANVGKCGQMWATWENLWAIFQEDPG